MYNAALFLHLLGVVLLVGAVSTTVLASLRAQRVGTVAELRVVIAVVQKIDVIIGPAMLLILADGLYMVSRHGADGSIRWNSGWVDVAIAIFVLMSVLGPTVESGHAKRLFAAASAVPDGPIPADLDALRRARLPLFVSLFGVSQIFAFVFLMSTKPGLLGALAACLAAAVVSAVCAVLRLRTLPPVPAAAFVPRQTRTEHAAGVELPN